MTMKEFLKELNILDSGYYNGNTYIIELNSDSDWSRVQSKLDKGVDKEILTPDEENNFVSIEESELAYSSDDYHFLLKADFVDDIYNLEVEELNQ